jgi:hypothetical protein
VPSTTTLQGLPYPVGSTDAPDGPAQILALAQAVEKKAVMVFASSAARTSAFSAAGVTATEGMLCWLQDVNRYEYYTGAAWFPLVEDSWTALTLPTGYTSNAGFNAPGYRRVGANRVIFRGNCNVAASNGAGTKFTMPSGYRPANNTYLPVGMSNGSTVDLSMVFTVAAATGIMSTPTASPAATTAFIFEGLSYSLD